MASLLHTHAAKFCVFCEFCGRTAHHKYLCKSVKSVGEKIFPQNARNSQKLLAEKSLPQISTDVHRYRRVWHPCHTHATKFCEFCGRTAHHKYLCKSVKSVGEKKFPQNARNTRKLLTEKNLPQMSTDAHRCRRVWHPCHTHADKFCEFCEFCERTAHLTICVDPCHPWKSFLCKKVLCVPCHPWENIP